MTKPRTYNKKLIAEAQVNLKRAVPLMSKYNVPIIPRNYAVWYKYVSGMDIKLNRYIDIMRENGEEFSDQENEALFRKFCTEYESEFKKIREDLQQILKTIITEVKELTDQTQDYESFVSESVDKLKEDASPREVKGFISEIIKKTKTLGNIGKSIRNKLQETTENLEKLKKDFEQIKTETAIDFLTGVPNRKAFDNALSSYADEAASLGKDLSILMIDIDFFKKFNDEHGHLIGDQILKFVAGKIREIMRGTDFLARFGGEEFVGLLPGTPLSGAEVVAENIRGFFANTTLQTATTARGLGGVNISIGVASYHPPSDSLEAFLDRSDKALYHAKSNGRNRVSTENDLNQL